MGYYSNLQNDRPVRFCLVYVFVWTDHDMADVPSDESRSSPVTRNSELKNTSIITTLMHYDISALEVSQTQVWAAQWLEHL